MTDVHPAPVVENSATSSILPLPLIPRRNWFSHVRLVSLLTLISRLLGLVRDMGMAAIFGNGPLLDSFTLAFRIPNLTRRLFGEGALTTAFLPAYIRARKQDSRQASRLATAVLLQLSQLLILLIVVGELLLWGLMKSSWTSSASQEIFFMTAWMLPYVLFICLSAQLGALLHAQEEFTIPAVVPILLNVLWIVALWGIIPSVSTTEDKMFVVLCAVLAGGLAQFLLPAYVLIRRGFTWDAQWKEQLPESRNVFRLMLPVVLGLSVTQINAICDTSLAWWFSQPEQGEWIAPGTASALYFGQRMYQFPLGIFGAALATVLFARLSQHAEDEAQAAIHQDVNLGLRMIFMVGIPATLGMVLLAHPLTVSLFQRGEFDLEDVAQTSATVAAYGIAIWAMLGVSLLQRVYYALGDAQTPVRIGFVVVSANLLLNFPLIALLGGAGLAYATSLSAILQFLLLLKLLRDRIHFHFTAGFPLFLMKILLAAAVMSGFCGWVLNVWEASADDWSHWGRLLVPLLGSVLIYAAAMKFLRVSEWDHVWKRGSSQKA